MKRKQAGRCGPRSSHKYWSHSPNRGWHSGDGKPWQGWANSPQAEGWHHRRRFFFARAIGFLGIVALLALGGMAMLAFLLTRLFGGDLHTTLLVWLGGLGLAMGLPLLALGLGIRAVRRIAIPLTDILATIDAVAAGDLSARVPEKGNGELARLSRSMNRMIDELERTDRQRRNLTADVAHELRTPLHIIQGNLEGVIDGVYAPTPEHMEITLEETRRLARLVDDLRTLSLAEAGELPMLFAPVDLQDLLEDVVTSLGPQAESAGVDLHIVDRTANSTINSVENGFPTPQMTSPQPTSAQFVPPQFTAEETPPARNPTRLIVEGDAGRLNQVLSNLVTNALRHTPRGGSITLSADLATVGKEENGKEDHVTITVADTGEGIAAEELPFVFDRFWRGDRARTHTEGAGSGLGLAIAGQLVKAHGGEIGVTSEVGVGTTFTVKFCVKS